MKRAVTLLLAVILVLGILPISQSAPQQGTNYCLLEDFEKGINGYYGGDLTSYGIALPNFVSQSVYHSGKGIASIMPKNGQWCEVLHSAGTALASNFAANADGYKYFMFYIKCIESIPLELTVSLRDSSERYYFSAGQASLYNLNGESQTVKGGNASGAAENSSITIPAGFNGYVVYSLNMSSVKFDVSNIVLDVRTNGALKDDSYGFDSFYLTNSPKEVIDMFNPGSPDMDNDDYMLLEGFDSFETDSTMPEGYSSSDLTQFGVPAVAEYFIKKSGHSGNGIASVMPVNGQWCEVLLCGQNTALTSRFNSNAADYQYFMFYYYGIPGIETNLTVTLRGASSRIYLTADTVSLYTLEGESLKVVGGDKSSSGVANSSFAVPASFKGYVVFKLDMSKVDFDVTTIGLDMRCTGAFAGDSYRFDSFYLTNDPQLIINQPNEGGITGEEGNLPETPSSIDEAVEQAKERYDELLNYTPQITYTPEYDPAGYNGIKCFYYDSVDDYRGQPTRAFGYIGYPEGASAENPVPAVLLLHGSGGYPFAEWIKIWNDRGYAAIAIQHGALMPDGKGGWTQDAQGGATEGYGTGNLPLERQWLYHAVAKSILANNILRADPLIDKDKIGVTGISAGGVVVANLIGYDARFAFAVPVYLFGYMHESLSDRSERYDEATYKLWEGSVRFDNVKMPVLILNSDSDFSASVNTSSRSFDNLENAQICIKHGLLHGHIEGWTPAEIYRFADSIVKDGEPLAYFTEQPTASMGRQLKLALDAPKDATDIDVTLYYTTEPLSYNDKNEIEQKWLSVQGTYSDGKVEVTVPAEASVYYISICSKTPSGNFYSSSRLVESPLDNPSQSGDNMTVYTAGAAVIGLVSTLGVLIYKHKRYN